MGKSLINILLILVLAVTILPIRQVGNMLFNNQWTEELSDHPEVDKKLAVTKWAFLNAGELHTYNSTSLLDDTVLFHACSQRLPFNPSGEIHSPPPNLL